METKLCTLSGCTGIFSVCSGQNIVCLIISAYRSWKTVTYSCTGCMRKWRQAVHSGSCVLTVNDRTSIIFQLSLTGVVVLGYPQLFYVTKILILGRVQVSWRGEVIFFGFCFESWKRSATERVKDWAAHTLQVSIYMCNWSDAGCCGDIVKREYPKFS